MNMEQSFMGRPEGGRRGATWNDLSPAQAGLAAALRRAFDMPADQTERQFADLLQKLS